MEANIEHPSHFPTSTAIKGLIGAFLIALGVLLALDNLDLVDTLPLIRWWPMLLAAIGLLKVVTRSGPIFGAILVVAGFWMTALNMGWIDFTIFQLWPVVLILIGGGMVARAFGWKLRAAPGASSTWAVLSSRNIVETTRDYRGGEAFAFMGGCRIDLTQTAMAQRPAVIDATAIWGGVEILVPQDWQITGEVVPVMGGFEMKCADNTSTAGGQLVVRGLAFMGGIEVRSVGRMS